MRQPKIDFNRALVDFPYYAETVLKIKNKRAQLVPFVMNRAQWYMWELVKRRLDAEQPVRMDILKARQLGSSTFVQMLMFWVTSTRKFRNSLVVSHEEGSASNLFNKSEVAMNFLPPAFKPMTRQANRNEIYFANPQRAKANENPGLESRIQVKTANNRHLAASLTLDFVHLSEVARYEDLLTDVDDSMVSLLQTVPPGMPWTFIFRETTAQGMGWYKELWDNPDDGYDKVFISWVADDSYTFPDPLSKKVLENQPDGKWGDEYKIYDIVYAELERWYPEITDEDDRQLEALKRLAWRRHMIAANFHGRRDLFTQEYPLTADEAFITSGNTVFDTQKIADIEYALRRVSGEVGGLRFPPTHYRYDKQEQNFYVAPYGPLRVYEGPVTGGLYAIGGDVTEGIDKKSDFAALQVLKLPEVKQVATYHAQVRPDDLADVAAALGKLYNWALLAVENNAAGVASNLRLSQTLYYPNLYRREIFDGEQRQFTSKIGWQTNRASKPVAITALREGLDEDLILFRDLPTLDEMMTYIQHKDGSLGAVQGKNDDLVMALAIALQAAYQQGSVGGQLHNANPAATEGTMAWYMNQAEAESDRDEVIGWRDYGSYLI